MKTVFSLAVMFVALLAGSAWAGEGNVPRETLQSLGLGELQAVSDAEGLQVRGLAGAAFVRGRSLVSGALITPDTKSFVFGSDVNQAEACMEFTCFIRPTDPVQRTKSTVNLSLNVSTTTFTFNGYLFGCAGGKSWAYPR